MSLAPVQSINPCSVAEPGDIAVLATRWLQHCRMRGRAINTQLAYRKDLEQFTGFTHQHGIHDIRQVSAQVIDDYLVALIHGEGFSPRTAMRKLAPVKSLFSFAVRRQLLTGAEADIFTDINLSFESTPAEPPETDAILRMINAIPDDTRQGLRDRALFRLMFDTGLRVSGVIGLDRYDPDHPPRHTVHPNGVVHYLAKGGRVKTTYCDNKTLAWLDRWMEVRPGMCSKGDVPALFLSNRGTRMSRVNVAALIKKYGKAVGLDIHCHMLRHRRMRDVIEATNDLRMARDLAGHESIRTTVEIYGTQSRAQFRRKLDGCRIEYADPGAA